ncbi:MAG: hypothetical protein OXU85_01010 [Thaumarchaeota archaeon]|nr:hypothetical protein [Nitrososphaerota archaeon]
MTVLEPFAGANNIPKMLAADRVCKSFVSYDVAPQDPKVQKKDTLRSFPKNFDVCITNPPWLGRYAAKRRGLAWPDIQYDDIYKHCLQLALDSCPYAAFIIPATFLQSCQFRERLETLIFINGKMFTETDNPVCLALFGSGGGGRINKNLQRIQISWNHRAARKACACPHKIVENKVQLSWRKSWSLWN